MFYHRGATPAAQVLCFFIIGVLSCVPKCYIFTIGALPRVPKCYVLPSGCHPGCPSAMFLPSGCHPGCPSAMFLPSGCHSGCPSAMFLPSGCHPGCPSAMFLPSGRHPGCPSAMFLLRRAAGPIRATAAAAPGPSPCRHNAALAALCTSACSASAWHRRPCRPIACHVVSQHITAFYGIIC